MIQNVNVGPSYKDGKSWSPKIDGDAKAGSDTFATALKAKESDKDLRTSSSQSSDRFQKPEKTDASRGTRVSQGSEERPLVREKNSDPPERIGPKEKSKIDTDNLAKKKAVTREKAIEKFMDSFENEFGIPPTRIVEAMAKLDTEKLEGSPEESAEAVVENFDLQGEDQLKAKEMYLNLLSDLNRIDQASLTPKSNSEKLSALSADKLVLDADKGKVLSSKERRLLLNQSLDRMNEKFWMSGQMRGGQLPQQTGTEFKSVSSEAELNLAQPYTDQFNSEINDFRLSKDDLYQVNPNADQLIGAKSAGDSNLEAQALEDQEIPVMFVQKNKDDFKYNAESTMENLDPLSDSTLAGATSSAESGMENLKAKELVRKGELSPSGLEPNLQKGPTDFSAKMENSAFGQKGQSFGQKPQMAELGDRAKLIKAKFGPEAKDFMVPQKLGNGKQITEAVTKTTGFDKSDLLSSSPLESSSLGLENTSSAKPLDVLSTTSPRPSVEASSVPQPFLAQDEQASPAGIQSLMNQTQYLVKKGGGEAKIKMNPEGMGQVDLRVMVQNGKVNLQMATETNEAKKLIESNLTDLKSSLHEHKLSVDHVKIDVINPTSTDRGMQDSTSNLPNDRENPKMFWDQFRNQFGDQPRRESFMEMKNPRGYEPEKKSNPLQPIQTSSSSNTTRKNSSANKGRGLDLVA